MEGQKVKKAIQWLRWNGMQTAKRIKFNQVIYCDLEQPNSKWECKPERRREKHTRREAIMLNMHKICQGGAHTVQLSKSENIAS